MPTETRFDDLDLREETPGLEGRVAPCSAANTCWTATKSLNTCSENCCA